MGSKSSLVAQLVKNPPAMQETWVQSLSGKIPWRRERLPTPVFWPGEFQELYAVTKSLTQLRDFHFHHTNVLGLPWWLSGKESACQGRRRRTEGFNPWVGKIPWRRKWQPTPVFLPRVSHGQRSLAGYSSWSCKKLDTTEHAHIYTDTHTHKRKYLTFTLGLGSSLCHTW